MGVVGEAFEELMRRIELDPTRSALASRRYAAVKGRIESSLPGKTVSQVGSFARKTKIRPMSPSDQLDVDAVVRFATARTFAPAGEGVTPGAALDTVKRALVSDSTYRLMAPVTDAPVVWLEYADGFRLELIPSFVDGTGTNPRPGGPACYLVGTSSGSWVAADYDFDSEVITGLNQSPAISGSLVPAIKMIKTFVRTMEIGLDSFHSEILAALVVPSAIANWESLGLSWGYQHLLAFFLSTVGSHLEGPISLPGSYSRPVDSGLSSYQLATKGEELRNLGTKAWSLCKEGDQSSSLPGWRAFFGDPFPG
jgi:hypothetical protein